jgi:hypothetical protein
MAKDSVRSEIRGKNRIAVAECREKKAQKKAQEKLDLENTLPGGGQQVVETWGSSCMECNRKRSKGNERKHPGDSSRVFAGYPSSV